MTTLKNGTRVRRCIADRHRPGEYAVITAHLYSTSHCTMYQVRRDSDGELGRWSDEFFTVVEAQPMIDIGDTVEYEGKEHEVVGIDYHVAGQRLRLAGMSSAPLTSACTFVRDAKSLPADSNPKDAVAQLKVDLSLIPDVFSAHVADALMDGAEKYGPFNWRDKKVQARVYVAAAKRHLAAWFANEETAEDSGVHHLGHAAACLAIILDAQHHGCLLDNRPDNGGKRMQDLFDQINKRRVPAKE